MGNVSEIFICDECDTLATMSVVGDTIILSQCQCLTLDWNN
jgi:hypothetical protein